VNTHWFKTKRDGQADDQNEPMRVVELPPACNGDEANTPRPSRAPLWPKIVLGLGFLLTALWSGLIVWGIVKVIQRAL
jgi:hypothetical protein